MSNTTKKQLKRKRRAAANGRKGNARRGVSSNATSSSRTLPALPDRRAIEGIFASLFDSGDDDSAVEQAQRIMYQAWEVRDSKSRVALARKALAISTDCADAHVLLGEEADDPAEARRCFEEGVAAGERALGREFFEENEGHFWGLLETRPYMRARAALAQMLWTQGDRLLAVEHYQDLLRLNPNDNQGIRQLLVGHLIELGRDADAKRLLDQYKEDGSAWMIFARVLVAYRLEGDSAGSRRALASAIKANPFVRPYLTGRKKFPVTLPAYHGFGDESEAIAYTYDGADAWRATPGALDWLGASPITEV